MIKRSAGILLYRHDDRTCQVLLAHPGGPYWRGKFSGSWQIPKGLIEDGEDPVAAARREVEEELGIALDGELAPLATIRQAGGKVVEAFVLEHDVEPSAISSNLVTLEWPRGSGKRVTFPEIDEMRWFSLDAADQVILASQAPLIEALRAWLAARAN